MVKRTPLTKEQIISKAIALADKGGLSAMSMRKLAGKLNVQAMSLYHHFKTKDDLISHMADTLVVQIDAGVNENRNSSDWRTIILNRAVSAKTIFQKHEWLPIVLDSHLQSGIKRLEYTNNYIGTLRNAGLPIELSLKVFSLIDSYIYGFCRQLSHNADSEKSSEELAEDFSTAFNPSDYPFLNEATALVMENGYDENADFLFGLSIILNGIELELKSLDSQ
ncbi:MAG: TetR/AcrR family transcriptional regulator [Candidatus Marinimicrobia bacterium]|nr:TetR/AcrR family transcriptional regulator [Candidatus Neomarinimicrobiota bacterium]